MTRTRMDAWNRTKAEGTWPAVLKDYEVAIGRLRDLDPPSGKPKDPLGWRFQAAIHGLRGPNGADTSNPFWCNCQHGSWYFLAWHRMYLAALELDIQHALEDDTWSLPYWYSIDPDDESKSALPPAFLDRTLNDNNLQTDKRSQSALSGGAFYGDIPSSFFTDALVAALRSDVFSTADGSPNFGGGERSDLSFGGDAAGLLEDIPHGTVHSLVGNDFDANGRVLMAGWMGSFFTAGLDPIFWLHHSNLDRLWEVWRGIDDAHTNPTDPAFLNTEFTFPHPTQGTVTWKIRDALDTTFFGYEYESLDPPAAIASPEADEAAQPPEVAVTRSDRSVPPRVLGAASDVSLASSDPVPVEMTPARRRDTGGEDDAPAERAYLRVEGITGSIAAPMYGVYVNVPDGEDPADHPELRAGSLSTFGLEESSQTDDEHDGSGLTKTFDITALRDRLAAEGRWDEARLDVRFTTHAPTPPEDLRRESDAPAGDPDVRARRVAVVAG